MIFRLFFLFIFPFFLASCGPNSLEDYFEEGESNTRELITELHKIRSHDDLLASAGELKRLFNQLTATMISAREYREKHPSAESIIFSQKDYSLSEKLRNELNRIYRLDEGREIIEKSQQEALNRLDAFEKRLDRLSDKINR